MPIKNRYRFYSEIEIYAEQFKQFAMDTGEKLAQPNQLTDQTRADIITKITEMESYFNVIKQTLAAKKPYEDTGFDIDEVQNKLDALKNTVYLLLNTLPKKESPPKKKEGEENKQLDDVEMKDDIPTGAAENGALPPQ